MSRILTLLVAGCALAATPAAAAPREHPDAKLERMLAGRVAGRPVDCISVRNVSSTIIEGRAIVYRGFGKLYVNVPRAGASSLDDDDILVTRMFGDRLCRTDTVNLVSRSGRIPHGFVLLGQFVPYEKVMARR
jgi:hypothetical protein